jgi:uncharacterized protein YukE
MPRVHFVKKARKAIKEAGVKKGDSYYWWKFRFGGKRVSKTPPKASQLTQSEFLGNMHAHQEDVDSFSASSVEDIDSVAGQLRDKAEEIRELGNECEEKYNNMPDSLQQGPTGELLQTRTEQCENIATELDSAADEVEQVGTDLTDSLENKTLTDEEKEKASADAFDQVTEIISNLGWEFE